MTLKEQYSRQSLNDARRGPQRSASKEFLGTAPFAQMVNCACGHVGARARACATRARLDTQGGRGNDRMYGEALFKIARASGRASQPGLLVPVAE
jgi:hypothetical protein